MNKSTAATRLLVLALLSLSVAPVAPRAYALEPPSTEHWYVMDREGWLRTDDERLVLTTYDLRNGPNLAAVPFRLGEWTGQDMVITNEETFPTLEAEQLIYRGYTRPDGQMLVLSLIGSSHGRSFHHPLVCYEWASWPAEDHGTTVVAASEGDVVMRVVIGRDPEGPAQVDLHAYLWPNDRREWADGATQIRVTAIATQGEDKALASAREFARLLFNRSRRPGMSATAPIVPPVVPPTTDTAAQPSPSGPSGAAPAAPTFGAPIAEPPSVPAPAAPAPAPAP